MADEKDDMAAGVEWRKAGVKQSYNYPEDIEGPNARSDPRCQKCGKTAYKAELVTYERIPYHKNCFKCVKCRKKLTPGEANPFGTAHFLCNPHFQQIVRAGGGSGTPRGDVVSARSAPAVLTGKSLVTGSKDSSGDDDINAAIKEGLEWRKAGVKQAYKYPEDLDGSRADPRCNLCGKTSYKAETITYERIPYHKNCFKCIQCKKRLTGGAANPFGKDVYMCNAHFAQWSMRGAGSQFGDNAIVSAASAQLEASGPSSIIGAHGDDVENPLIQEGLEWRAAGIKQAYKYPEDLDGSRADPRCNLCGKTSYKAETVTYERIPYHKNCFKCVQCKKRLTGGAANPFGKDVYLCNAHFMQFALRGGGLQADSTDVVSADSAQNDDSGPSVVGGAMPKKKKTSYKPPSKRRK